MTISIKNSATERLAREVASVTGESVTMAVTRALSERLERLKGRRSDPDLVATLLGISARCSRLPDLDRRSAEEILGYDDRGTWG